MAKLFISYAVSDRVMVESLAERLRSYGHDPWIDTACIQGGSQWETEIVYTLAQCEICLIVVTPSALESDWVKKETEIAKNLRKFLIPLIMHAVPMPSGLAMLGVEHLQAIDFARYGHATSLQHLLGMLSSLQKTLHNPRALIIEDIPAQQNAIRSVFKVLGVETVSAFDFDTAFDKIRQEQFDIVTLDLQLDQMDVEGHQGLLLLDQVHTHNRMAKVIIISVLNVSGSQVRDFLRKYNAYDYLKKPFDLGDLRKIIESALSHE